ncbi:hypothetical protein K449DRAFT_431938 [Hypoxylon sp. EC38]|nr:hypothetical protein K449DRAFT_431938 [Hypoxylon sp. EC38]
MTRGPYKTHEDIPNTERQGRFRRYFMHNIPGYWETETKDVVKVNAGPTATSLSTPPIQEHDGGHLQILSFYDYNTYDIACKKAFRAQLPLSLSPTAAPVRPRVVCLTSRSYVNHDTLIHPFRLILIRKKPVGPVSGSSTASPKFFTPMLDEVLYFPIYILVCLPGPTRLQQVACLPDPPASDTATPPSRQACNKCLVIYPHYVWFLSGSDIRLFSAYAREKKELPKTLRL